MKSVKEKIEDLDEIRKKIDVGEWEDDFITGMVKRISNTNGDTRNLTEKQVDKIDQLWEKRCAFKDE
jgi:hypothetical protein